LFIGLPGNPVSAFVGFEVFVRPALIRLGGEIVEERPKQRVTLAEAVRSDGRETYMRVVVQPGDEGRLIAQLTGHQGSGNLLSLVKANGLLILPAGTKSLPAGAEAEVWMLEKF
jgi:molybdopterin molybdotransferase